MVRGKEWASKSNGSGTFNVFVSSSKFMKDLSFLEDNYVPRVKRETYTTSSTEGPKQPKVNHAELLEKTLSILRINDFPGKRLHQNSCKKGSMIYLEKCLNYVKGNNKSAKERFCISRNKQNFS